jgi:flagellar biogenesis protein FliO
VESGVVVSDEVFEYLKLIAFLAAVVVLALVAMRYWLPKLAARAGSAAGPLQVACRLSLEPRKTIYVVRAGSNYVLLAASDAGVQFLSSLDATQMEAAVGSRKGVE